MPPPRSSLSSSSRRARFPSRLARLPTDRPTDRCPRPSRDVWSTPVTTSRWARYKASKCYHGDVFFFSRAVVTSAFEATITVVSDGPIPHAHQRCAPRSFRTDSFDGIGLFRCCCCRGQRNPGPLTLSWVRVSRRLCAVPPAPLRMVFLSVPTCPVSSRLSPSRCPLPVPARPSSRAINVIREMPHDERTTLTTACRIEWN